MLDSCYVTHVKAACFKNDQLPIVSCDLSNCRGVGCIFAEMCSGVPIFPGVNDVADQLDRIFSIRGLPDPNAWPDVKELPNYGSFHFAPYVELSWDRVDAQLGRIPDSGDKLLTSFLQVIRVMEHWPFHSFISAES